MNQEFYLNGVLLGSGQSFNVTIDLPASLVEGELLHVTILTEEEDRLENHNSRPEESYCGCEMQILMARGCQCGGI